MTEILSSPTRRLVLAGIACLTIGIAPIYPEMHVLGKLRWIFGGAVGMAPMDWVDLALHGAPFVWFAVELGAAAVRRAR
ncbi:MAG: hypothetical protein ABMA64_27720 [Myxococcota bacterium]